jgi:hypothetical protein
MIGTRRSPGIRRAKLAGFAMFSIYTQELPFGLRLHAAKT